MNVLWRIIAISILFIIIGQFISCEESPKIEYEFFNVHIDSIEINDNIIANTPHLVFLFIE